MTKGLPVAVLATRAVLGACEETGTGEYAVKRPTMGVTTDTVSVPTVDAGTDTAGVITPDVDVTMPGASARPGAETHR